jgi:hypothetical protein
MCQTSKRLDNEPRQEKECSSPSVNAIGLKD